jgi:hypothetical protein
MVETDDDSLNDNSTAVEEASPTDRKKRKRDTSLNDNSTVASPTDRKKRKRDTTKWYTPTSNKKGRVDASSRKRPPPSTANRKGRRNTYPDVQNSINALRGTQPFSYFENSPENSEGRTKMKNILSSRRQSYRNLYPPKLGHDSKPFQDFRIQATFNDMYNFDGYHYGALHEQLKLQCEQLIKTISKHEREKTDPDDIGYFPEGK